MTEIKKNKKQFLFHFLIWVIIVIIISIPLYIDRKEIPITFFYRILANIFLFYINYSILVPFLLLKKRMTPYFLSIVFLLIISYLVFTFLLPVNFFETNFRIPKPRPNNSLRGLKSMLLVFTLMFIIVGTAIRMYREWINNERNKKEIEAKKNLSELEALKNQLNPHFLFNSLNSIYSLTVKKSNDAPEAVITLSELMRYMLYQANDDFVLLRLELDYIENYIKLQRLRIANNQNVKINIHGTISNQKIRPLLFISYIENAFKYGTDYSGNTEVKIEINVVKDELQFKCINLIGSKNKDEVSSGIGMQNTVDRLQLLYPEKHSLKISEIENRFIVDLKLKLE